MIDIITVLAFLGKSIMAIEVTWFEERRIVSIKYSGNVTLEDMREMCKKMLQMLETGVNPLSINSLVDLRDAGQTEFTIKEVLSDELIQQLASHPNQHWQIYIGRNNPFHNMMASVISQNSQLRMRFVDTLEEGLAFLDKLNT